MTITGKIKAYINNEVKPTYDNIVSVKCVENFKRYKPNRQSDIMIKVALIAAAVGIITGVLFGLVNPVLGVVIGVNFAISAGVWAFGHYTMPSPTMKNCIDKAKDGSTNVRAKIKRVLK